MRSQLEWPFIVKVDRGPELHRSAFFSHGEARAAAVRVLEDEDTWPGSITVYVFARELVLGRGGRMDEMRDDAPVAVYRR